MTTSPQRLCAFATGLALLLVGGCGRKEHAGHDHAETHGHAHAAPHGGTLVVLGDEAFHLEFVLDSAAGRLDAYVLDGEAEKFIRIAQPALALAVVRDGTRRDLELPAIANAATGESAGDTAQFAVVAPLLKGAERFDGTIKFVTIRGSTFESVAFRFPEGNENH